MAYTVHVTQMTPVHVHSMPVVSADVVDLPTVDVDVDSLPDLTITEIGAVGPVTLAGIPDRYTVAISQLPDLNLRLKEIPSIRAHVPANFRLGFSLLGVELAALQLCGEAQVITEPYVRNPCEYCGSPRQVTGVETGSVSAVLRVRDQG
ncbi:MAG: hypothetical protein P8Z36_03435 [Gemmatimonadota bacterium]|jgi:hypothetical protein